MNSEKKVALVTGASSGIGESTARLLLQAGYVVYAAARRLDRMAALGQAGARLLALNVAEEASLGAAIDAIKQAEGRLDVLVNNAGYGSYGALEDVPLAEARYQFEVNVFGLARLVQLALPLMRAQRSGRIINVSSIGGRIGEPHGGWYHATKFAVEGLSDSLRMELKQFGIDVVVIQPGAIKTEWNQIARENLLKISGSTAYANLAQRHVRMLANADARGSEPEVVARTIVRAATTTRPKTRYATGGGAKVVLLLRRLLSDRLFDKLMLSQMR
ncbi:oxidoreductase [Hymenobacter terrenus]|uniref:oxidoreductase n=1 Tax=Hymenobacter terrenus TaxID=1629124 RepID=UPI00061934BA|nr:oxidoreductase [Hymenobacter terrenus]